MSDQQTFSHLTDNRPAPLWIVPSYEEANKSRELKWDVSAEDYDGIFELIEVGAAQYSKFPKTDMKTKEVLYEKDSFGNYKVDAMGKRIPIYPVQSQFLFRCLSFDAEHPTPDKYVGEEVRMFLTLSMNEKSNMYPVIKALFGGQVDPGYQPDPADLVGRMCKATVKFGKPKEDGTRWPTLDAFRPARGVSNRPTAASTDTDDVPF